MRLWRIASRRYDPLDGEGARLQGGRWNSPGRPVVYAASNVSLAVLETLVWVDPEDIPADLDLFEIEVSGTAVAERIDLSNLPAGWTEAGCPDCTTIGDEWLASNRSAMLIVPSAVVPEEKNVLLNPRHPDAQSARVIKRRPFTFDLRLLA